MYYGKTNKSFAVTNILANSSESNQFPSSLPPDKLAVKLPHVSFLMDHHEPSSYLNLSVVITISTTGDLLITGTKTTFSLITTFIKIYFQWFRVV